MVNAINDAFVTLGKLWDARRLADSNGVWNEDQRILAVGKEADKHKQRILKKIDLADADLAANIAHTEKLLSEPLTEKAGLGSLNHEVRAHAKALDRKQRSEFIAGALKGDDELTLTALLGAPPYLSGLTKIDQDHYLRLYHSKLNPHLGRPPRYHAALSRAARRHRADHPRAVRKAGRCQAKRRAGDPCGERAGDGGAEHRADGLIGHC